MSSFFELVRSGSVSARYYLGVRGVFSLQPQICFGIHHALLQQQHQESLIQIMEPIREVLGITDFFLKSSSVDTLGFGGRFRFSAIGPYFEEFSAVLPKERDLVELDALMVCATLEVLARWCETINAEAQSNEKQLVHFSLGQLALDNFCLQGVYGSDLTEALRPLLGEVHMSPEAEIICKAVDHALGLMRGNEIRVVYPTQLYVSQAGTPWFKQLAHSEIVFDESGRFSATDLDSSHGESSFTTLLAALFALAALCQMVRDPAVFAAAQP